MGEREYEGFVVVFEEASESMTGIELQAQDLCLSVGSQTEE